MMMMIHFLFYYCLIDDETFITPCRNARVFIVIAKPFIKIILVKEEPRDNWVAVTMAWRVLRLRMEERPPIRRVAANILNKQSMTADKGLYSSFGIGRDVENSSL